MIAVVVVLTHENFASAKGVSAHSVAQTGEQELTKSLLMPSWTPTMRVLVLFAKWALELSMSASTCDVRLCAKTPAPWLAVCTSQRHG